jgi:hypothetical protein
MWKGAGCEGVANPVPGSADVWLCERHWVGRPPEAKIALKFDKGKLRMELIDPVVPQALASILTFGAKKYGPWNWAKGFEWSRVYGALQRHLTDWYNGEDNDPETGESHLHSALCNLAFLISHETRGLGQDDRPFGVDSTSHRPEAPTVAAPPDQRHDASGAVAPSNGG